MKIQVIPTTTESTRDLCKTVLYSFLTFATPFILYRCIRSLTMYSSSSSSASITDAETLRHKRINSTKLYLNVTPSKVPIIYSSYYDIRFLGIEKLHPFDSTKWGRICRFLILEGYLAKNSIVEPLEASMDDLLVVHTEAYLNSLKSSGHVARIIEVPFIVILPNWLVQMKVLYPFRRQVGGTILAAKLAKERGWALNVGGGFHHCCSGRGVDFVHIQTFLFAFILLLFSKIYQG